MSTSSTETLAQSNIPRARDPRNTRVRAPHALYKESGFIPTDGQSWRSSARFGSEGISSTRGYSSSGIYARDSLELGQPCLRPKSPTWPDLSIVEKVIKRMRRCCRAMLAPLRERRREPSNTLTEAECLQRCIRHGWLPIETEEDRQAIDQMRGFRWPDRLSMDAS